jgi:hypothetical protein
MYMGGYVLVPELSMKGYAAQTASSYLRAVPAVGEPLYLVLKTSLCRFGSFVIGKKSSPPNVWWVHLAFWPVAGFFLLLIFCF